MKRRDFLSKAGLLVSGYGFSKAFQLDLMDKLARTLIPMAEAEAMAPRRVLEICIRAGFPLISFGAGKEFLDLSQARYSNYSYAGNQIMRASANSSLYMNTDSATLLPHAANIAITQGVETQGGHTAMFNYREGGQGKRMASPIIELTNKNPTQSLVHGIQWEGDVSNSLSGKSDLIKVTPTSIKNLFKKSVLKFSDGEMQSILEAAKKLSRSQAVLLEREMKDSLGQFRTYEKSLEMVQTDYSSLLTLDDMPTSLTAAGSLRGIRETMGLSLKALQHNLTNSALVVMNIGDLHGFQTMGQLGDVTKSISEIIAAAVDYLKITPDPAAGSGKTLWDTTVIVAGSEFTRGITAFDRDNSDGGTQGIMLIGKDIQGGYYGGFDLDDRANGSNGMAHGFDRLSGKATKNKKNTTTQLYQTARAAMGIPLLTTEKENVLYAMLK